MKPIIQEQKIVIGFKVINDNFLKQWEDKLNEKNSENFFNELAKLIINYKKILELCESCFLVKEQNKNKETNKNKKQYLKNFSKKTKIHYLFVRRFLNFDIKKPARARFIFLKDVGNFNSKFIEWFNKNKRWINNLDNYLKQSKKQNTFNKKETALIFKKINSNEGINFIEKLTSREGIEFFGKKMDKLFLTKEKINKKAKEIKEIFPKIEKNFLAKTDVGLNIFNGSLNYFSVNKKLDSYKKEREKIQQQMNGRLKEERYKKYLEEKLIKANNNFNFFNFYSDYFIGYNKLEEVRFKDFLQILKNIKGKEKTKFLENIHNLKFEDLEKKYPLFKFEGKKGEKGVDIFKKFKSYSLFLKLNKSNKEKIKIAKKRGGFLDYKSGYCRAPRYKKLVKLYEKVAKDYGRMNARLKAIENNIDNIRKLKYWLIFSRDIHDKKSIKLIAIPKDDKELKNLNSAYSFLKKIKSNRDIEMSKENDKEILILNSFTLKALNKLLFREDSSFRRGLSRKNNKDYIDKKYLEEVRVKYLKSRNNKYVDKLNDKELVKFYQQVLKTRYAQENLKFDFNKIKDFLELDYDSVEKFRLDLEKKLYGFEKFYLSISEYQNFLREHQAIEFSIVPVNNKKNPQNRQHKEKWSSFWSDKNQANNFSFRINPEIRFFYKEKDEDSIQSLVNRYGKKKVFSDNFKHRFLENRIIIKINFESNIPSKRINFSFKEKFEINKEIKKFNKIFNQKNKDYKNAYYFGLDRGTNEFVSLVICKNELEKIKICEKEIEVYKIKDEFLGQIITSQQKWFNNFDRYFEKVKTNYLDLTTAKLVNNKIIINSEWKTLFKLTKLYYKKRILSVAHEIIRDEKNSVCFEEKNFFVKTDKKYNDGKFNIGCYRNNFSKFTGGTKDEIKEELKKYIKEIENHNFKQEVLLEKYTNYKNALAANVVGILDFLRKNFLKKYNKNIYFVLENLNIETIDYQSQQQAFATHRQLEWILLNKLRKECLVPSNITKQIIFRAQDNKDKQFGAVLFLNKDETSTLCPYCGAKRLGYSKKEFENKKFSREKINCKNKGCGGAFYPDQIACINLAKKGFKFLAQELKDNEN